MTSPRLYQISQDGELLGEFTEEQARHYLADGSLQPDDIAWAPGLESWQPLQLLFLTPVKAPPPLPQTSPAIESTPGPELIPARPVSKGPLTPNRPSIPTISSIYNEGPPPLPRHRPHQRPHLPHRTIIPAQSPAPAYDPAPAHDPAPPPIPQSFQTNLPAPSLFPVSTPTAPSPATWLPPADPHFVPVHLRPRHNIFKWVSVTLLIVTFSILSILLTAHFTGYQDKLVEYLPALEPVFQWLTQNIPTALPEAPQAP